MEPNRTVKSRALLFQLELDRNFTFFFAFFIFSFFYLLSLNQLDHHHINSCIFYKHNYTQFNLFKTKQNENKNQKRKIKTKRGKNRKWKNLSIILLSAAKLLSAPCLSNSTRFRNWPCRLYGKFLCDFHYFLFSPSSYFLFFSSLLVCVLCIEVIIIVFLSCVMAVVYACIWYQFLDGYFPCFSPLFSALFTFSFLFPFLPFSLRLLLNVNFCCGIWSHQTWNAVIWYSSTLIEMFFFFFHPLHFVRYHSHSHSFFSWTDINRGPAIGLFAQIYSNYQQKKRTKEKNSKK